MTHKAYLTVNVHNGNPPNVVDIGEGAAKQLMHEIDSRSMESVLCKVEYGVGRHTLNKWLAINPAHVAAIEVPDPTIET